MYTNKSKNIQKYKNNEQALFSEKSKNEVILSYTNRIRKIYEYSCSNYRKNKKVETKRR